MADQIGQQNDINMDQISKGEENQPINKGGGGDANEGSSGTMGGGLPATSTLHPSSTGDAPPSSYDPAKSPTPQQHNIHKAPTSSLPGKEPSQKDGIGYVQDFMPTSTDAPNSLPGPNELFFGGEDRSSGLSYKDREERVRQLRERQQHERQQKLEELKEQAAAAQRFREQQEAARRQRLDEMRSKDSERRSQVEERKRLIQQAEQERREAVLRKSAEREHRLELKRRQERSNAVFAFGSSTPRMLDPKENSPSLFGSRRATSTTNVNLSDSSSAIRRSSECQENDLSRKRATSAHSLNRKPDDLRMSTSMYEVFNWDDGDSPPSKCPLQTPASQGEETSTRPLVAPPPPTAARRRTDLLPTFPSLRDTTTTSSRGSPRHRSPGRALSLGRLDQLARPRPQHRPPSLAPLHESPSSRVRRMTPARTMSKSMSHIGPQRARTPIGPATDGVGVPVADGLLDRRSSRSSLALAHPRMTRAEMLRLSKLRGGTNNAQGLRSGTVTPGSPSRPTSALSQASGGSQVTLRNRTSPTKKRPMSIAGSTFSSADKPRDTVPSSASPASPNRESRSIDRKSSTGSVTSKQLRAKSAGSDQSTPSTPAKTSRGTTPKRTPAQVKAESAAKKSAERTKAAAKPRSTPKTTPLQSPSVESKALPGAEKKAPKAAPSKEPPVVNTPPPISKPKPEIEDKEAASTETEAAEIKTAESEIQIETQVSDVPQIDEVNSAPLADEQPKMDENTAISAPDDVLVPSQDVPSSEKAAETENPAEDKNETEEERIQAQVQRAAEKPVTGYASEEDYKAALAEKRRQAREAKERELELERQKKLEEEEKERREEEEFLRLIEEQKKAEEERLKKAIMEAERLREEEATKKEEEEKQRIEAEKIEQQKKLEAEEKMKKEEEERQMRKSRVAAIMSRTRGKGSAASPPSKAESKTPSDETKTMSESLMSSSMTESLINNISSSMSDSMIVEAIQTQQAEKNTSETSPQEKEQTIVTESFNQSSSTTSSQPPSDVSSQPLSDLSSQLLSDTSSQISTTVESHSVLITDSQVETQATSAVTVTSSATEANVDSKESDLITGLVPLSLTETQINGNAPVPMETTPTSQPVDLLGSYNGVNGVNHNGMDSGSFQSSDRPDNQFGSLDPLNTPSHTILPLEGKSDSITFDQIIDLNQTKLTNEDAVNSNPPPPVIAFEDNLNKKSQQTQETSSNVPDLLL